MEESGADSRQEVEDLFSLCLSAQFTQHYTRSGADQPTILPHHSTISLQYRVMVPLYSTASRRGSWD